MRGDVSILSTAFRYFLAVAEAGSIRAAARDLNIVSSAVNRQILMLEESLGIRLFDRVGRGLRLSEAGIALARQVRDTLARYEDTVAELDTLRGLRRGRIRIATVEPGARPLSGDDRLTGRALLPAMPNLHSHTFQRAMAGMTERRGRSRLPTEPLELFVGELAGVGLEDLHGHGAGQETPQRAIE